PRKDRTRTATSFVRAGVSVWMPVSRALAIRDISIEDGRVWVGFTGLERWSCARPDARNMQNGAPGETRHHDIGWPRRDAQRNVRVETSNPTTIHAASTSRSVSTAARPAPLLMIWRRASLR